MKKGFNTTRSISFFRVSFVQIKLSLPWDRWSVPCTNPLVTQETPSLPLGVEDWTWDLWGVKSRRDVGDRQTAVPLSAASVLTAPQSLGGGNIIKSFWVPNTRFHTRLGRYGTRSLNYNIKEQRANKRHSRRNCFNLPHLLFPPLDVVFPPPTVSVALQPSLPQRVDQS